MSNVVTFYDDYINFVNLIKKKVGGGGIEKFLVTLGRNGVVVEMLS